jgi:GT2 family glycosyltransferase
VESAEQNEHSLATSKIYLYGQSGRLFEAGWKIDWPRGGFRARGNGDVDKGQYDAQVDVPAATTTSLLINTAFFSEIGVMDAEEFPQYLSDIDFTHRAFQKGYRIIYQPKSKIWHKWFGTMKKNVPNLTSFLATFKYLTRDPNSAMNFHQVSTFWRRHYPFYMIPYVFFRYALLLVVKSWRHNILFLDLKQVPVLKWFVRTQA